MMSLSSVRLPADIQFHAKADKLSLSLCLTGTVEVMPSFGLFVHESQVVFDVSHSFSSRSSDPPMPGGFVTPFG